MVFSPSSVSVRAYQATFAEVEPDRGRAEPGRAPALGPGG